MADLISTQSLIDLDPDSFVDLFEIYISESTGILRFHAGKNFNSFLIYKGNPYTPAPIEYGGFEFSSDGKQSRPSIRMANINGVVTNIIKNKNDLVNSRIKRLKIFVKNLDDVNFSDGKNPFFGYRSKRNATNGYGQTFFEENYIINRKVSENKYIIEFELSSPLDFENQSLPNRKISDNLCSWSYRGCGCNYGKLPWANESGEKQSITYTDSNNNVITKTADAIFGTNIPNIGIPFADENDKEFYSAKGYNLGMASAAYKGFWDKLTTYTAGEFVTFCDSVNYDFFGNKFQFSEDNISVSVFVCIKGNNTNNNPKLKKEFWIKDACSKNIKGCSLRWKGHKDGLPFGGFPGTRPFNYQT